MNDQIKLQQMWKAINVDNYPLKIPKQTEKVNMVSTRACTSERLIEPGLKNISQKTLVSDAIGLWNTLPIEVKNCESIYEIKKAATAYSQSMPIYI